MSISSVAQINASPPPPPLSPQIQEQIIEDIMNLEEKFGDQLTAADMPFLEASLMAPQTVGVVRGVAKRHHILSLCAVASSEFV